MNNNRLLFSLVLLFACLLQEGSSFSRSEGSFSFLDWILFNGPANNRGPRNVKIHDIKVPVNTEWLTDEQLSELGQSGSEENALAMINHFYHALEPAEAKKEAASKISKQCYAWLPDVTSDEERTQLEAFHHTDHAECKKRVAEYKARLPQERQTAMGKYWDFCEHVWVRLRYEEHGHHEHAAAAATAAAASAVAAAEPHDHHHRARRSSHHHRTRRDHHGDHGAGVNATAPGGDEKRSFEDYFKTHLSWLSETQREELKAMKTEGKTRADMHKKALEYFDLLAGEPRQKAAEEMKAGCKHLGMYALGAEKVKELQQMKDSGATQEEISTKVTEFVAQIQDEKKKALATEYVPICRKFFREPQAATVPPTEPQAATVQPTEPPAVAAPQSRRRRDHHHEHAEHHGGHTLEDYFKTHLSWLNDAQREQIRTAKAAGATRAELQNKVKQFYSELAGDDQEKAKSQLQEGCRELIRTVFGQEKANELKQMRESGTPVVEVAKKLEEMIGGLTDPHKKATVTEYQPYCKQLFGVPTEPAAAVAPARMRRSSRSRHQPNQQRYANNNQVRAMAEEDEDQEPRSQPTAPPMDEDEDNSGARAVADRLAQSQTQLDSSEENSNNGMRRSTNDGDDGTRSPPGSEEQTNYGTRRNANGGLTRIATTDEGNDDDSELQVAGDDRSHNQWLTPDQRRRVQTWRSEGQSDADVHGRIYEMFGVSDDTVKIVARGILERGCETIMERLFGAEEAQEIMQMRRQGSSGAEIDRRITTAVQNIENDDDRQSAGKYALTCRQIFGFIMRRRRETTETPVTTDIPTEYTLDQLFNTHLVWLTDEQKEELKTMKASGQSRTALQEKTMEFFKATTGDQRRQAARHLYEGCRELLVRVIGEEKANELRTLRETGASPEKLEEKANAAIAAMEAPQLKQLAKEFGPTCRNILLRGQQPERARRQAAVADDGDDDCED